jgi:hypothetical protein
MPELGSPDSDCMEIALNATSSMATRRMANRKASFISVLYVASNSHRPPTQTSGLDSRSRFSNCRLRAGMGGHAAGVPEARAEANPQREGTC